MLPRLRQTQINSKKYDNIETYDTLASIMNEQKVKDRLYFIKADNKYYRYDDVTETFIEAIGATDNKKYIQTYDTLISIPNDDKVKDKLYFIKADNKYYRYDDVTATFKQTSQTLTAASNINITDNIVALNNSIDISGYVVSNTMTTNSIQANTALHEYILMKSITNPSNPSTITINRDKIEWNNGGHSIQRYSAFFASEVFTQYETTPLSSQNTLATKSYVDNQVASGTSNGHTLLEYTSSTLTINTTNKIINLIKEDLFLERTVIGEYLQMQTSSGLPSIKIDANLALISGCTEAPTEPDHLTNKAYVDGVISSIPSTYDNTQNNNRITDLENVNSYNPSLNIFNLPNNTYSYPFVVKSGGTILQPIAVLSNMFWNVKDMVYVCVSAEFTISDTNFNNTNVFQIQLPFKKRIEVSSPTIKSFGEIDSNTNIHGNIHTCYGGIMGHKIISHVICTSQTVTTTNTYCLAEQFDIVTGNPKYITSIDIYNKTVQFQTTFYYKATWPLVRVV